MVEKVWLVVTGASRGFGRAVARAFHEAAIPSTAAVPVTSPSTVPKNNPPFCIVSTVLIARSLQGLRETKQQLLQQQPRQQEKDEEFAKGSNIDMFEMDLGNLEGLEEGISTILERSDASTAATMDRLILINNAGSLGTLGPSTCSTLSSMRQAVDLNITSSLWMSVRFVQHVLEKTSASSTATPTRATIINISSLAAVQPLPTMGIYSAGKAARDMFHTCLAQEVGDPSSICVLNYAPGPLETDMANELRSASDLDTNLKLHFQKQLVDPLDSARCLVQLVLKGDFQSGAHVDYFDVKDDTPPS